MEFNFVMDDNKQAESLQNLMQHIDPSWRCGYRAAQRGIAEESNPFPPQSDSHKCWLEGWWVGLYDNSLNIE